jgi:hypothetical protein
VSISREHLLHSVEVSCVEARGQKGLIGGLFDPLSHHLEAQIAGRLSSSSWHTPTFASSLTEASWTVQFVLCEPHIHVCHGSNCQLGIFDLLAISQSSAEDKRYFTLRYVSTSASPAALFLLFCLDRF